MRIRVLTLISILALIAASAAAADSRLIAAALSSKDTAGSLSFQGNNIDVLSWSWGVSNTTSDTGGGGGAGKATLKPFTFVKKLDKSSAALFSACASGQHIQQVVFSVLDEKGNLLGTISFGDVFVSDVTTTGSGGATPTESISLTYGKVEIKY